MISKHQRAAIAGRQAEQFSFGLSEPELLGLLNNFLYRFNLRTLFVNRELRVTNNVDEQDMPDLEL